MDLKKIKTTDFLVAGVIIGLLVMAFVLREVLLPFAIGMFLAYLGNPLIVWMQQKVKSRGAATALLLFGMLLMAVGGSWFTTHIMSKQVDRLHTAFRVVAENQKGQLDEVSEA